MLGTRSKWACEPANSRAVAPAYRQLVAEGWQTENWKGAIRERVLEQRFCGEDGDDRLALSKSFSEAPVNPDAYRLLIEGPTEGWGELQT
jgi:hypothetical protein